MIHNLTMGHLDVEALREGRLVPVRPLDMESVSQLLHEMGEVNAQGRMMLGGFPIEVCDGYLVCPWLVPSPNLCVEAFARELHQRTDCLLADVKRREIISVEQFGKVQ